MKVTVMKPDGGEFSSYEVEPDPDIDLTLELADRLRKISAFYANPDVKAVSTEEMDKIVQRAIDQHKKKIAKEKGVLQIETESKRPVLVIDHPDSPDSG